MTSVIPFIKRGGKSPIFREIVINRSYSLSDKFGKEDTGRGVSIGVKWYPGDRREKEILEGIDREQSAVIELIHLLVVLKEMYPEYSISFTDPYEQEVPTE